MRIPSLLLTVWITITCCSPSKDPVRDQVNASLDNAAPNVEVFQATYRRHGTTNMISYQVHNKDEHPIALNIWGWFVQRDLDSCLQENATVGPSHKTYLHNEVTFLGQPSIASMSNLRAYTSGWLPPVFALVESGDTVSINVSWVGEPVKVPATYWLRLSLPVWYVADAKKAIGAEFRWGRSISLDVGIGPHDPSVKCIFALNYNRSYTLSTSRKDFVKYDELREAIHGRAESYTLRDSISKASR